MKKIVSLLTAFVMSFLFLLGCSCSLHNDEYPVHIGHCTIKSKPESVVCLSDSVADILIACGYADRIVARSDECTQPELSMLPSVGSKSTPSAAKIDAITPDIVFADRSITDDAYETIKNNGTEILIMMPAKTTEDLVRLYESLGAIMGGQYSGRQNSTEKVHTLLTAMSDLQRTVPAHRIVVTACYLYDLVGHAEKDDTLSGKLFGYADAVNVCGTAVNNNDALNKLKLSNPEYIFCDVGLKSALLSQNDYSGLKAVKNHHVYEIDALVFQRQGNSLLTVLSFMIESMYAEGADTPQESSHQPEASRQSQESSRQPEPSRRPQESSQPASSLPEESSQTEESSSYEPIYWPPENSSEPVDWPPESSRPEESYQPEPISQPSEDSSSPEPSESSSESTG